MVTAAGAPSTTWLTYRVVPSGALSDCNTVIPVVLIFVTPILLTGR